MEAPDESEPLAGPDPEHPCPNCGRIPIAPADGCTRWCIDGCWWKWNACDSSEPGGSVVPPWAQQQGDLPVVCSRSMQRRLTEQLDSPLKFERWYAKQCGVAVEGLRSWGRVVIPCECGDEGCMGWASMSRDIAEDYKERGKIPADWVWPPSEETDASSV